MVSRKAGKWTRTPLEEGTNQRALEANVDVNKYVVRVDDRQLRLLVHQLLGEVAVANATFMETEDEAERNLTQAIQTHTEASMRLGEILRSLD